MNTFSSDLKESILEEIVRFRLVDSNVAGWTNYRLLQLLLGEGYLTLNDIKGQVHNVLILIGIQQYKQILNGKYPDHVSSCGAFGYAVTHDKVMSGFAKTIKFDPGETIEDYKKLAIGLVERVTTQLLTQPKDKTKFALLIKAGNEECFDSH